MASEQSESDGIVELRRSCRKKRNREEWEETLHMKVRRSRASGNSATVAVVSLGGQPSHKKKCADDVRNAVQSQGVQKNVFCGGCGNRHQSEDKFCRSCGLKRGGHQVVNLVSSPTKSAKKKTKCTSGRQYKKQYLRCGWQKMGDKYIAPDGKLFNSRAMASKYSNNVVSKLEPERKDGWQVYTNETGSHTDWIAPDGTKLFSYSSASAFAKSSSQPLFGKDGITKTLASFFHQSSKPAQATTTSKPAQATTTSKPAQRRKVSKARVFTVPKQTDSGVKLQRLCRSHEVSRKQATKIKLEQQIAIYTKPRSIKNRMANKITNAVAKNIFTYGNLVDSAGLLLEFLQKPEIRYLLHFKEDASIESEKARKVYNAVIHNIRKYLSIVMQTKGPRKKLAEQAFRTVVAACSGPNLVKDKTVRATSSVLDVHARVLRRGLADRAQIEEAPGSGFVKCSRKTYRNKMPDQVWAIIDEFLHSDLASRQDNYRKRKVILTLPADLETGEEQYCVHWQRELRRNWKSLFVLLSGLDARGNPVAGLEPTSWWKQIVRLTKTPTRPNGIIGSYHLLTKRPCPCLVGSCISQCSCPHCTTFLENLDHRHLAFHNGWRKTHVCVPVPVSADTTENTACNKCGGECQDRNGTWAKMSGGLISFLTEMLCPPVVIPNVVFGNIEPTTGLQIPGDTTAVVMIRKKCWLGECNKCGWDNRFSNFPLLPLTIKEDNNSERKVFVRACPVAACTDKYTTYHEFRKMERGFGEDGKPYIQPEWTPVTTNRRMFYYQLVQFMKVFLPHYYKVRWHETFDKVFNQQYKRLAFVGVPSQPQPLPAFKGTAILIKDFAACIDHDRKFNKTCSYPEKSHEWVGVYQCQPYLHRYTEEERAKRRKYRSIKSVVRQKVFGICAFSKRKGDCVFDQTVQKDLVHVMRTGRLSKGSNCEWFWRGQRLQGSSTTRPLPSSLSEAGACEPLHPDLKRLVDKRDRCTGQFQGANAFYSNQEFESRAGVKLVDLSQTSCHGKGVADGFSNVPTGHLRQAAKDGEPVGPGTRGLSLFLASKMTRPKSSKTEWMSFDEYFIAYYPEESFDKSLYTAENGYAGSNLDHFYTNSGLHRLAARHLRCFCNSCMSDPKLYSSDCQLQEWCGDVRHYNLVGDESIGRVNVRPNRDILTVGQFALTLGPGGEPCERVVVCKVHDDDVNELDEPFYLARIVSKARTLSKDCLVGGNKYDAGQLVVNIKWYQYTGDSRGSRLYRLQPASAKGVVYSVESIVRNISGIKFSRYENGRYVLDRSTVNKLTTWLSKE